MKMWKYCRIFMKRFREGVTEDKILCRDIANVDWMNPDQAKSYRGSDKFEHCRIITGKTAMLVGELMEKAQTE